MFGGEVFGVVENFGLKVGGSLSSVAISWGETMIVTPELGSFVGGFAEFVEVGDDRFDE